MLILGLVFFAGVLCGGVAMFFLLTSAELGPKW